MSTGSSISVIIRRRSEQEKLDPRIRRGRFRENRVRGVRGRTAFELG